MVFRVFDALSIYWLIIEKYVFLELGSFEWCQMSEMNVDMDKSFDIIDGVLSWMKTNALFNAPVFPQPI